MAAAPVLWSVGRDVLWCLGLGLFLAAARDLAGLLFGDGPVLRFLWDVLAFAGAAVLLCGFAASASSGGGARWYMACGLCAGAMAWHWSVSGTLHTLAGAMANRFLRCADALRRTVTAPFVHLGRVLSAKKQAKIALKTKKDSKKVTKKKKQLQKQRKILYN